MLFDKLLGGFTPPQTSRRYATDLVRGRSLTSASPLFEADQNGVAQSAIRATGSSISFYSAPSGTYFGAQYTFLTWFKFCSCVAGSCVFDFGDANYYNNLMFSSDDFYVLYYEVSVNGANMPAWTVIPGFTTGVWYHIGVMGRTNSIIEIYVNGLLVTSVSGYVLDEVDFEWNFRIAHKKNLYGKKKITNQ